MAPVDERASGAHGPDSQGCNCQTRLFRHPRPAAGPSRRLPDRLRLRPSAQDPAWPHPLRVHLQDPDKRASTLQTQSTSPNARAKQLERRTLPFEGVNHAAVPGIWLSARLLPGPTRTDCSSCIYGTGGSRSRSSRRRTAGWPRLCQGEKTLDLDRPPISREV